jgi:Flp pilus assembly protein TadG
MLRRVRRDDGQLTLLIIGFVSIGLVLVVIGVDVSKVFLARRALSSVADAAALAGAQSLDRDAIYTGAAGGCGDLLPLDPSSAQSRVEEAVADDADDLHGNLADMDAPEVNVDAGVVTVQLGGDVSLPFAGIIGWLDPRRRDGRVHVNVVAHAQAPLTVPDGC